MKRTFESTKRLTAALHSQALVLILLLCMSRVRAVADDPKVDRAVLVRLESAAKLVRPAYGHCTFLYEHWKHPRYVRAEQFESQVQQQMRAFESEKNDRTTSQIAENKEAIPINAALRFMNDEYQKWDVMFWFDGDKFKEKRTLRDYTSRLEMPPNQAANPQVRTFDAAANSESTYSWNGNTGKRLSVLNAKTGMVFAIVNTTPDKSLEHPPFDVPIPPLSQLIDRIDEVNDVMTGSQGGATVVKMHVVQGTVETVILAEFSKETGRLSALRNVSTDTGLGETIEFVVTFGYRTIGSYELPVTVEYASSVQFKGIDVKQLYERRRWTFVDGQFERPAASEFDPLLPKATEELAIYHENERTLHLSKLSRGESFSRIVEALNKVDLSNADAVRHAASGVSSFAGGPDRSRFFYWLVLANVVVVVVVIAVMLRRRMRQKVRAP